MRHHQERGVDERARLGGRLEERDVKLLGKLLALVLRHLRSEVVETMGEMAGMSGRWRGGGDVGWVAKMSGGWRRCRVVGGDGGVAGMVGRAAEMVGIGGTDGRDGGWRGGDGGTGGGDSGGRWWG